MRELQSSQMALLYSLRLYFKNVFCPHLKKDKISAYNSHIYIYFIENEVLISVWKGSNDPSVCYLKGISTNS